MDFAIITEKHPEGAARTLRSTVHPPPPELQKRAAALDSFLSRRIKEIEAGLAKAGLLDEGAARRGSDKPKGNVSLWHALGRELNRICREWHVAGRRERRWLWEAIENIHATERIKRARRGRTRLHFEYCYRLAQFPLETAARLNWSEWVYFFDSPTVREEQRADEWLRRTVAAAPHIDRRLFRRLTENLNRRIRGMDTSVLSKKELFALYAAVWKATTREIGRAARAKQ